MQKFALPHLSAILILAILMLLGGSFSSFGQRKGGKGKEEIDDSDRRAAEFYFIDGEKYFMLEDYAKALNAFQQCLDITPENPAVYYKIADIMYRNEDYQDAELNITKALSFDNSNKFYYLLAADIKTAQGNMDGATFYYEEMLAGIPETEDYYIELAGLYLYQNKLDEALKAYESAEEKLGISGQISLQKQQIFLKQNNIEEAIQAGWDLVETYPGEPRFLVALGEVMYSNGKEEEAIVLLNDFLEEYGNNPNVKLLLSEYFRKSGNLEESSRLIKESFSDPSLDLDIKTQVLVQYISRFPDPHSEALAIELGEALIATHPDEGDSYLLNADLLSTILTSKNGEDGVDGVELRQKASLYYYKSLTYDPSNFSVWQNLLNLDLQMRKWDSLSIHSEEAVELFPNQPVVYLFAGISLSQQKDYEQAVFYLEQGLKLATDKPQLLNSFYSSLGTAYNALGDHANSDKAYEAAIELNPYDDVVLNNYSYYLSLRKDKLNKARKMSLEVVRRNPNNATYLDTYAWVLYKLKEYDEAKRILEKVIQSGEANAVYYEHYGDVLYKLGDVDGAVSNWEEAKKLDKNIENIDKKISKRKLIE